MDPGMFYDLLAAAVAAACGGVGVAWLYRRKTAAEARLVEAQTSAQYTAVAKEWIDALRERIQELEGEVERLKNVIDRQREEIAELMLSFRRKGP